jgi:hypothetical protein
VQFVFAALLCVFAGIYSVKETITGKILLDSGIRDQKGLRFFLGRLFFRSASGVMALTVAVASRTGVKTYPYYLLILIGLCASLSADVLFVLAGRWKKYRHSALFFSSAAGIFYLSAFYTNAPFSWRDVILFVLIITPAVAGLYNREFSIFKSIRMILYSIVLGAVSAKGISMLFVPDKRYAYIILAAAGSILFSLSNFLYMYKRSGENKTLRVLRPALYYLGQALIAMSVMV